jgi:hypothetical protein
MKEKVKQNVEMVFDLTLGFIFGIIIVSLFITNMYEREDVNHDGKVDIKDLLIIRKHILNIGGK